MRILLIQDRDLSVDIISEYFLKRGDVEIFNIVHTLYDAIKLIKYRMPDIILLDTETPQSSMNALLESININDVHPKPDVIVLSSINNDAVIQESCMLGASYYIAKPIRMEFLYKRVFEVSRQDSRMIV